MKQRKKCNWGAIAVPVIGGVFNLIGGYSSARAARKLAEEQAERQRQLQIEQNNINRQNNTANILNNYNNVQEYNANNNTEDDVVYRKGGRKKLRNAPAITDGGVAIPIGDNRFLLRGSTHEQINETGQTGIGINTGREEIEAQDGEVIVPGRKYLRVYSNEPMFNGISPAELVEAGVDKEQVFNAQESIKNKLGIDSEGKPVKRRLRDAGRRKAPFGTSSWIDNDYRYNFGSSDNNVDMTGSLDNVTVTASRPKKLNPINSTHIKPISTATFKKLSLPNNNWGLDLTKADWVNLGADVIGGLGVNLFNRHAYDGINYKYELPEYVDESAVNMDTKWRIGARLADRERQYNNSIKNISRNTASSNVARGLMQMASNDNFTERAKLYEEKANKETELRNVNAQNIQQVRARNAAARNQWLQNVATIKNQEINANNELAREKAKSTSVSLQGIGNAITNMIRQGQQRYYDRQNQLIMAEAANPGSVYRLVSSGALDLPPRQLAAIMAADYNNAIDPGIAPIRKAGARPERQPNESAADYNIRLQNWRDLQAEDEFAQKRWDAKAEPYLASRNRYNGYISMLASTKRGRKFLSKMNIPY